ncbi:MAG: hypothetical protein ACYS47_14280 [Planctomycetota bacterium]
MIRTLSLFLPVLGLLLALPSASPVLAGEGAVAPSAPKERDVPEPALPGLEQVPAGFAPTPWETWAQDQDVDRIPRISIRFMSFGAQPLPFQAGDGKDSPKWDDITEFSPGFGGEFGYNLTPALEALFMYAAIFFDGNEYAPHGWDPGMIRYDFDGTTVHAFGVGLKFRLPFGYRGSRLLRFSRTEAPDGFCVYVKGVIGAAMMQGLWVDYYDMMGTEGGAEYTWDTTNVLFAGAVGMEYRWVHFGICLEIGGFNFGAPDPSTDPVFAGVNKAAELASVGIQLGLSLYL